MLTLLQQLPWTANELLRLAVHPSRKQDESCAGGLSVSLILDLDRVSRPGGHGKVWDRMPSWPSSKNTGENESSTGHRSLPAIPKPSPVSSRTNLPRLAGPLQGANAHACQSRNCRSWKSVPELSMVTRSWFRSTAQR